MSTPSTYSGCDRLYPGEDVARRRLALGLFGLRRGSILGLTIALTVVGVGCGYSGGKLLFMLGFGRGAMVEAKFRLTDEPVLILVDDPRGRIDWPIARRFVVDELSQELIKKKAAKKIVPRQTLERLRQSMPDFEKRGCREIGRLAGASQVLWLEVQDFLVTEDIRDASEASFLSVVVKVIDANATRRSRVKLWPTSPSGYPVYIAIGGSDVQRLKTKDVISKKIARLTAEKIAKFFYDRRLGDFEREE